MDTSHAPVSAATVDFLVGEQVMSAETDANGEFQVNLNPGSYEVHVMKDGYEPFSTMYSATRDGNFVAILTPSVKPNRPTITFAVSAGDQKGQYRAGSEISRSGMFTAYGSFNQPDVAQAASYPWGTQLGNLSARYVDSTGTNFPVPLFFANGTQFSGAIPGDAAVGRGWLYVSDGRGESDPFGVNLTAARLTFFQFFPSQGFGIFTHLDGSVVTPSNPAQAGEIVVAWLANQGRLMADGDLTTGDLQQVRDFEFRLNGVPMEKLYVGATSFANGAQANLTVPADAQTSCKNQVLVTTMLTQEEAAQLDVEMTYGVPVAFPIVGANDGQTACSDPGSFDAEDHVMLGAGPINTMAVGVHELNVWNNNTQMFDQYLGTDLVSWIWDLRSAWGSGPTPPGTCELQYDLHGANFFAPTANQVTGSATLNTPFSALPLAAGGNVGDFANLYQPPAAYSSGNVSMDLSGLEVNGMPMQGMLMRDYTRKAGLAMERFMDRLMADQPISVQNLLPRITKTLVEMPPGERATVKGELRVSANDSFGTSRVRCLFDEQPLSLSQAWEQLTRIIQQEMPRETNHIDFTLRFFEAEAAPYRHSGGPVIRTDLVFDASISIPDVKDEELVLLLPNTVSAN